VRGWPAIGLAFGERGCLYSADDRGWLLVIGWLLVSGDDPLWCGFDVK